MIDSRVGCALCKLSMFGNKGQDPSPAIQCFDLKITRSEVDDGVQRGDVATAFLSLLRAVTIICCMASATHTLSAAGRECVEI